MNVLSSHPSFKVKFNNDFKKVNNSEFVEGTALIAYSGDNRNSSDITESAFNEALPSLGLVPLVGHWLAEKQNFGGHDITIEFVGNQLVLKDNTVPYGVVKENNNAEWVEIEENGVKHNYLKADVVLWYGRYPEPVQKVIDDGINQSMEINVQSYSEKDNGNFQIDKFEFSALCLLGKDVDENGNKGLDNVEPCFESASVIVDKYTVNNKFKEQFSQLLFALNPSFKISSYFIAQDQAEQLVQRANSIFTNLGFECSEYIVDGKEHQITGIINKTLNEEATKVWGFDIYDKDTITIYSLDFEAIDTASISISSVELLVNKNITTNQQHFTMKFKEGIKGGENEQMSKIKEGENMDEKLELLKKYSLTSDSLNFNIEEVSIEELEIKIQEHFALLASQKEEEVINALRAEKYMDRWGDECTRYSYVDHNDSEVFAWDRQQNWILCGFTYSMSGDSVLIDFASMKRKKFEIVDFVEGQTTETFTLFPQEAIDCALVDKDKEFTNVTTEFEELKIKVSEYETKITENETTLTSLTEQFNSIKEDNIALLEYKNNNELEIKKSQIEDIISDFESVLGENEEFKVIKINALSYEIEALEEKLYALEGKIKHAKNTKQPKKTQTFSRVSIIDDVNNKETDSYYGDGIKFIPKN